MNPYRLAKFLFQSALYHWRMHLAVGAGVAIACAVLTGALITGDSIRASLRSLARERLGRFHFAVAGERFFAAGAAERLARSSRWPEGAAPPVPALILRGAASREVEEGQRRRAGGVTVAGVPESFFQRGFPEASAGGPPRAGFTAINAALARELGAQAGDSILLSFQKRAAAPLETFAGSRAEAGRVLRVTVERVIPDRGPGLFSLEPGQAAPRLAYLDLAELGRAAGAAGEASALLVAAPAEISESPAASWLERMTQAARAALRLEDLGFRLDPRPGLGCLALESRRMILDHETADLALAAAKRLGVPAVRVLTHLAESIALAGEGGKAIPYSTVSALEKTAALPFGPLALADGGPAPELAPGEILLNDWAARDLGLDPRRDLGREIVLTYYVARPDETAATRTAGFRLRGVVALDGLAADRRDVVLAPDSHPQPVAGLKGLAADRGLTPEFPGITDRTVKRMSDWKPPFSIDLARIRKVDEDYWEKHRATPKAFLSWADGERHFASRFGPATSILIAPRPGESLEEAAAALARELIEEDGLPEKLGFAWRPLRAQSLEAASGSTDFAMLFASFSFFLIIAAALLVALLFNLGIDRRSRELGTLLAMGFSGRAVVWKIYLAEGLLAAGAAGLAGLVLSWGYAALLIHGLATWWWGAVRAPYLVLEIRPGSLLAGYAAAEAVVALSLFFSTRRLRRLPVRRLLAGGAAAGINLSIARGLPVKSLGAASGAGALAIAVLALAHPGGLLPAAAAFFAAGALALVAGGALFSAWLRFPPSGSARRLRILQLWRLGARNAGRAPGRSLLTFGMVAAAVFLLAAVMASRRDPAEERPAYRSGNGGFALAAAAAAPLTLRFDTATGRKELGLEGLQVPAPSGRSSPVPWSHLKAFSMRVRPGDEASCLNLYAVRQPRLLGAPPAFIERGGFLFQAQRAETSEERANPWKLLQRRLPDGALPAIGDASSVAWILHKKLGEDVVLEGDRGEEVRLRIVATLSGSLFQGELVISEEAFLERFPGREGFQFFLLEFTEGAAPEEVELVERGLEEGLERYGFEAVGTGSLLARYQEIENTYLSTFGALGGLGLLFGTAGLAVVLLRHALERRGELALLQALGFRRGRLMVLVLAENVLVLAGGMLAGLLSALLAIAPRLLEPGAAIPWLAIAALLAAVFLAGGLASLAAAWAALRAPLLSALRAE
ncbi:MAG: FtsX-like permease family protein [Planctomycetes bacterium]|nr:FtsX-like permease family protein [Planctomycetota bacterium]